MKKIVIFLSLIFFIFLISCDDGGHQSGDNGDNNDNVKNENIFITQAQGNGVLITGLLEKGKLLSDISVPETIDGKSVIGIKSGAFAGCTNLVRITLAKSIESIGANAFSGCTGLESITVKSTPPPALETGAFDGCTAVFFVPAGYKGTYANSHIWQDYAARIFESDAIFIYSISGDRVIAIAGLTDYGLSLSSLNIPTTIDGYPVTTIKDNAFKNCSGLTGDLIIPNSITSIGNQAFEDCSGFTGDLIIPDSVTSIGGWAFKDCSGFTGNLVLSNSLTRIKECAFYGCLGFSGTLTIPENVTEIEGGAFCGCHGFSGVFIPSNVTTIEMLAFQNCSGLTGTLTLPASVTSIGSNAFNGCSNITSVRVENNVPPTLANANAFDGCTSLTKIYVPYGYADDYKAAPGWSAYSDKIDEY